MGLWKAESLGSTGPEELKERLTIEELYTRIKSDLYVNAYEDNAVSKISFRGKDLAEFLETALFVCPNCQGIGTLKSQGDVLSCRCGLKLRYTEPRIFRELNRQRSTVYHGPRVGPWQRKFVERQAETYKSLPEDTPIPQTETRRSSVRNPKANLQSRRRHALPLQRPMAFWKTVHRQTNGFSAPGHYRHGSYPKNTFNFLGKGGKNTLRLSQTIPDPR
ncbi:MAG: hypothetical protein ACOX29_10335 [Bacillota bacterium]